MTGSDQDIILYPYAVIFTVVMVTIVGKYESYLKHKLHKNSF